MKASKRLKRLRVIPTIFSRGLSITPTALTPVRSGASIRCAQRWVVPIGLLNLDSVHAAFQGLMMSMPQPSKSFTFRVAMAAPQARTIAAIWQSASMIGLPAERRAAAISA